jgi:hypothetical protein
MLENNKDKANDLVVNKTKIILSKFANVKDKVCSQDVSFGKGIEVEEVGQVNEVEQANEGNVSNNVVNRNPTTLLKRLYKSYRDTLLFSSLVVAVVLIVVGSSATVEEVNQVFVGLKPGMLKVASNSNNPSKNTDNDKSIPTSTPNVSNISNISKSVTIRTDKNSWQDIDTLLASTEKRRSRLFSQLGISKGEYVLACVSVHCGDCDDIALELNQKANLSNIIAISSASVAEVEAWKNKLGLKFRVASLSVNSFDDSGAVILPTLIRVKDSKALGVSETATVVN